MDSAQPPSDFDMFYHYDSASTVLDGGLMRIKVPSAGFYYVGLSNIYITFPNGGTAPVGSAILTMEKFDSINNGSCITGDLKQSNKVLFPLNNPENARPTCRVYNRILLDAEDSMTFNYYDITFTKVPMDRTVVTIHISNNPDIIRGTL